MALVAAGLSVEVLPSAGADAGREPRIRAVRAKADAFVSGANRARNFGRARDLKVDSSPIVRTYVRFKVDVTSGDVRHVSLLLYSRTLSRTGVRVRLVEDAWREQRITFLNAPPLAGEFVISGPFKTRAWKAIDVTSLAEDVSDDYVSLVLTTPSPNRLELASRETGLHGPRLVVERESSGPTTTATTTDDDGV